jgi:hypothetical protein
MSYKIRMVTPADGHKRNYICAMLICDLSALTPNINQAASSHRIARHKAKIKYRNMIKG